MIVPLESADEFQLFHRGKVRNLENDVEAPIKQTQEVPYKISIMMYGKLEEGCHTRLCWPVVALAVLSQNVAGCSQTSRILWGQT